MGTILQPTCVSCRFQWREIYVFDAVVAFCKPCDCFVALRRVPYTRSNYRNCEVCSSTSINGMINIANVQCPRCKVGNVRFDVCGSFLPDLEVPPLKVGDIVEGWFDSWSVRVFDMPAIPRENVTEAPQGNIDGFWRLETIGIPKSLKRDDRSFYFRLKESL